MQLLWTTAFVTGLVGSLHCVGMCGPIALALPIGAMSKIKILLSRILYNLGRIFTYSLLGLLMGFIGQRLFLSSIQQYFSIGLGIFILVFIIATNKFLKISPLYHLSNKLKSTFKFLFQQKTLLSMFVLGFVNGLLPCGLLYMAVVGSIVAGSPWGGMIYMALFGLGTAPALFAVAMVTRVVNPRLRRKFIKIAPIYTFVLAVFLIIRGLNLGSFMSPKFINTIERQVVTICH